MRRMVSILNDHRGSALIIGLLTLTVLSLIGTISTTTSSIEGQIAGNEKTYKEAFYASELSLSIGEMTLEKLVDREDFDEGGTAGHYGRNKEPAWQDLNWDDTDSILVAVDDIPDDFESILAMPPRYTLEERRFIPDSLVVAYGTVTGIYQFNVTATGHGGSLSSEAVLQTIYAKRYN